MRDLWCILSLSGVALLLGRADASLEDWLPEELESECSTTDLDHSKLVECKLTQCEEPGIVGDLLTKLEYEDHKVLHMFSSRSGDRFNTSLMDSLDFIETDYQKSMDINTTLYVNTLERHAQIYGFGTTLDLEMISSSGIDDATSQAIIEQLFSQTKPGSLKLSYLRIPISREILLRGKVMSTLKMVDGALNKALGDDVRVKLLLSFDYWPNSTYSMGDIQALEKISLEDFKALDCWGVTIMPHKSHWGVVEEGLRDFIRDRCSNTEKLFSQVPMNQAAQQVSKLLPEISGLLIQSDFKSTYSNINQALAIRDNLNIMTLGSPKSLIGDYGNWQTAQHHAVEIMNHLRHNSMGFIESESVVDVFSGDQQQQARDGSVCNLGPGYESYFKGPIFYAMGHFSKLVTPGSIRLETEISTQPNMFAADYMAFMTPQKNVVAIVLNDNEHDLSFRLAIDKRIKLHVMLKSKSFNTFVIKSY